MEGTEDEPGRQSFEHQSANCESLYSNFVLWSFIGGSGQALSCFWKNRHGVSKEWIFGNKDSQNKGTMGNIFLLFWTFRVEVSHVFLFLQYDWHTHFIPNFSDSPVKRAAQYWLDKSTIHTVPRWILFTVLLSIFFLRIYLVQGYFIVAYGLGIFLLNNFIAFLSPLEDPTDSPGLPTTASEGKEYRPFARRLPEFKFWLACTKGTATCLFMTFFSVFDIPVFWPILLMYFFILFFMTMKRQIMHM